MKRGLFLLFVAIVMVASYEETEEGTNICCLLPVTGLCLAYIPSWYYNVQKRACETFIYGGCGANENNFLTKCDCQKRCGDDKDICCQPRDMGQCRAAVRRWFYNSTSGACEQFTYGGCQGNKNNFQEKSQCEQKCLS